MSVPGASGLHLPGSSLASSTREIHLASRPHGRPVPENFRLTETPLPALEGQVFMAMLPYLVTVLAVAGVVGRTRGPAATGIPYVKG